MTKPALDRLVGGILIWLKEEIKNRIMLCRICNMDIDKSQGTDHNRSDDMACLQKIIQAIIQMPRRIGWELSSFLGLQKVWFGGLGLEYNSKQGFRTFHHVRM